MGSYLDLDDAAAGHPKAEHELHLMRGHIKGLESALEELETLRAENEQLDDKLQEQMCLVGSLLEENARLIAEREAMMKQEPVGYKVNDTKNKSEWITTIQNPEKYKLDYPDFVLTPVYARPLPAQQITEGYAPWTDRQCAEFVSVAMRHVDINGEFTWDDIRLGQKFANKLLSASQPKGDEWIEIPKFLRRGDD